MKKRSIKINRRKFLKRFSTYSVISSPLISMFGVNSLYAKPRNVPELTLPDDIVYFEKDNLCSMSFVESKPRVLVAYSSMYGSTGGIAKAIGQQFCDLGWRVDLKLAKNVTNIEIYDAVIIGSAIRGSEWLPESLSFIKENEKKLSEMPTAYFISCMTLVDPEDPALVKKRVENWMAPLEEDYSLIKPIGKGFFKGAIEFKKLPSVQRLLYPIISGNDIEGDFRDFKNVKLWSFSLEKKISEVIKI